MHRVEWIEALFGCADEGEQVFALLDGAAEPALAQRVFGSGLEHRCLLPGRVSPALAQAAPRIVRLEREDPLVAWLFEAGWGNSWGTYAISAASVAELVRHLRRLLRATLEDGRRLMFRYFDPRVLQVYLPTCTPSELDFAFGPASTFVAEDPEGDRAITLSWRAPELWRRDIPAAPDAPAEALEPQAPAARPESPTPAARFLLRAEQVEALRAVPDRLFVEQLLRHVQETFPQRAAAHDAQRLTEQLQAALAEGRRYGLLGRRDLCRFVNLAMERGLDWRDNPRMGWADAILRADDLGDPSERLARVVRQAGLGS